MESVISAGMHSMHSGKYKLHANQFLTNKKKILEMCSFYSCKSCVYIYIYTFLTLSEIASLV